MAVAFLGDHDVAFTTTFTAYANKGFADRAICPKLSLLWAPDSPARGVLRPIFWGAKVHIRGEDEYEIVP